MSINPKVLGKLNLVDLRDFWEDEARDFTPWLADLKISRYYWATLGIES